MAIENVPNFMAFWRGDRLSVENELRYPEPKEFRQCLPKFW